MYYFQISLSSLTDFNKLPFSGKARYTFEVLGKTRYTFEDIYQYDLSPNSTILIVSEAFIVCYKFQLLKCQYMSLLYKILKEKMPGREI